MLQNRLRQFASVALLPKSIQITLVQYSDALRYLDERSNYERTGRVDSPSIENIERLMDAIANPQHAYRSIHITGTNGKGSTAQITTKLLMAHGLRVGTYSSPHLDRINDRICINGEPISDEEFGLQVGAISDLEIISEFAQVFSR